MSQNKLLVSTTQVKTLSKTQAKFNKLVAQIEQLKIRKIEFAEELKVVEQKYQKQILPLALENKEKMLQMIKAFDKAFDTYKLTKKEQEAISRLICQHLSEFIQIEEQEGNEENVKTLKALYLKHEGEDFDENQSEENDMMADMMEQMFGFKVDPNKLMEDEDYQDEMRKKLEDKMGFGAPKERKKSKKQLEKEAKEKEAEDKMKKDARSIYTQLAKLLHPDTEQDEAKREVKTELMKRVTNAYSANDLYELLQIQLEVEQLDDDALANVSDDLMGSYVKVLQKQVDELQMEINYGMKQTPIYQQFFTYTDKFSDAKFRKAVNQLKDGVKEIQVMINNCNNPALFKGIAKDLVKEFKEEDKYDYFW
jgi:hypothetical protein